MPSGTSSLPKNTDADLILEDLVRPAQLLRAHFGRSGSSSLSKTPRLSCRFRLNTDPAVPVEMRPGSGVGGGRPAEAGAWGSIVDRAPGGGCGWSGAVGRVAQPALRGGRLDPGAAAPDGAAPHDDPSGVARPRAAALSATGWGVEARPVSRRDPAAVARGPKAAHEPVCSS
jgi:hypothetical protein